MNTLTELNKKFQNRLLEKNEETVTRIRSIYFEIYKNILSEFEPLIKQIEILQLKNKKISKIYLYKSTRFVSTIQQVTTELKKFTDYASDQISSSQREAVDLAIQDSPDLIRAAVGKIPKDVNFDETFLKFDTVGTEKMIARFSDGSPIKEAMEKYVGNLIGEVEIAFVQAIVKGLPARALTNELVKKFGMAYINAETSSRTNIVSAYRDANLERYSQTKVVKGWVWSATLDDRTCPVCVYMDGQFFELDVPFATHPVCRCSPLPVTYTWAELGINAPEFVPNFGLRGEDWFEDQSDETQKRILKREKFELYKAGKLKLKDLVHYFDHPTYGPEREEYSLKDLKRLKVLN